MPIGDIKPLKLNQQICVADLVEQLKKKIIFDLEDKAATANASYKYVTEAELHRPGLALAGYIDLFTSQRIQVIGNTEAQYLSKQTEEQQKQSFSRILEFEIPVIFLTSGNSFPDYMLELANNYKVPVYSTNIETTRFMFQLRDYLDDQFALQTLVHGSMVDVYGIGIMIAGQSGIGKSEVALDLVERGHRLVADDAIMLTKKGNILMASATEMNGHFMEIRGLGIIDVMSMFGIRAVRYQKRLEILVELFLWDETEDVDRTGLDKEEVDILGIPIPYVRLPISPGKNITVIAEVIAMNYLLKHYGYDAAQAFQEKINKRISEKTDKRKGIKRSVDYFESDLE